MLSIPKYSQQYAQHFPAIFYLLCCAFQHHVIVMLRPLKLMWLRLVQVSFNPLNPLNTLWLRNLNPNPT